MSRAPIIEWIWAQFDASRRRTRVLNPSRDKNARLKTCLRHATYWGGGRRAHETPDLSFDKERRTRRAKTINGMGKKENNVASYYTWGKYMRSTYVYTRVWIIRTLNITWYYTSTCTLYEQIYIYTPEYILRIYYVKQFSISYQVPGMFLFSNFSITKQKIAEDVIISGWCLRFFQKYWQTPCLFSQV